MKIAVLTSGILPVPAVLGGAVENLIDFYLEYNDVHKLHDITVYSVHHPKTNHHPALQSTHNHYIYIDTESLWARTKRKIYSYLHKNGYHNYFIEFFLDQALKHISRQNYDIIILENRPSYSIKLRNRTQAKLVYHLHNEKLNTRTYQYQIIYDSASLIINVSDFITKSVQSINPNDKKCVTVHNGIDIAAFSSTSPDVSRKDVGLDEEDFVIIYSGRINPEKGIKELIEAMCLLKDYPNIKLLVIGSSFFGNATNDDDFMNSLRKSTATIKARIYFTGYIPYNQVPSYLKLADLAIVPSMWDEAFGLTVLEAMAAGLPLIATRSGGIPEICEGVACIIERNQIVNNLVLAIKNLYHNPIKRKDMSYLSYLRAQDFSKEKYAKSFFHAIAHIAE